MTRQASGNVAAPHEGRAYVDPVDGSRYPINVPLWRSDAGRPLLISAGTGRGLRRLGPADIDSAERSLWRYRAALPIDIAHPISLGEGCTPLVEAEWGGAKTRFKLEWFSPTGSFKDRGASVMLSALRDQGVTRVLEDSSGNGGAAVAAYGAAGGLGVTVFAPASTSPAKLVQARAYGAEVRLVEGPREASQAAAIAAAAEAGSSAQGFYASHNWQAFFLEGTKTLAYEIWEDLGFRAPDHVIVPVGAGSSLLGCAMGFRELMTAGLISRLPRLHAAQPLNCSPVDAAFRGETAEREVRPTMAEGTAIRRPIRLALIVEALRSSGGQSIAIPEAGILHARDALARAGMYVEPTSATAAAALTELRARGAILPGETTVVVLTGSGLKTPAAGA